MPVIKCHHEVMDSVERPPDELVAALHDIAPSLIRRGATSYLKFRQMVYDTPELGPKMAPVIASVWREAAPKYTNGFRREGDPVIEPEGIHFLPTLTSMRTQAPDHVFVEILDALHALADDGKLREARGGYDVLTHAQAQELADAMSFKAAMDDSSSPGVFARSNIMSQIKEAMESTHRVIEGINAQMEFAKGGKLAELDAARAQALTDLGMLQNGFSLVAAVHTGKMAEAGRLLRAMADTKKLFDSGVAVARSYYHTFEGTGALGDKLMPPRLDEIKAELAKPVEEGKGVVADALREDAANSFERAAWVGVEPIRPIMNIKPPTGIERVYDAIRGATVDRVETPAQSLAVVEYQSKMDALYDKFWRELSGKGSRGATIFGDSGAGRAVNTLAEMLRETLKFQRMGFNEAVKTMRELYLDHDLFGDKGQSVDHIADFWAPAFEKATGRKPSPEEIAKARADAEASAKSQTYEEMKNLWKKEAPPRGDKLVDIDLATASLIRLREKYARDRRATDVQEAMGIFGTYAYEKLKAGEKREVSFTRWMNEIRANVGVDIDAGDYQRVWENLKADTYRRHVKPELDRRAIINRQAGLRMSSKQYKAFMDATKDIDENDPNAQFAIAREYQKAMGHRSVLDAFSDLKATKLSFDYSAGFTQLAPFAMDPRRVLQSARFFLTSVAAGSDESVYRGVLNGIHTSENADKGLYHRFARGVLDDDSVAELFSSNRFELLYNQSKERATTNVGSRFVNKLTKGGLGNSSVVEFELPAFVPTGKVATGFTNTRLAPGRDAVLAKTKGQVNLPTWMDVPQMSESVAASRTVSFDTNIMGSIARGINASNRAFKAQVMLFRKAALDRVFADLEAAGYDSYLDSHLYQAAVDNVLIMTGASNLSVGSREHLKTASKVFTAPTYRISALQGVMRVTTDTVGSLVYDVARIPLGAINPDKRAQIEAYTPSTDDIRKTGFHQTFANDVYNARHIPSTARAMLADQVLGMVSGAALSAFLWQMQGAEIQMDPRHKYFWTARIGKYRYDLPMKTVANVVKYLAWITPPHMRFGIGGPSKQLVVPKGQDKADRPPVPGIVPPGRIGVQYNAVERPVDGKGVSKSQRELVNQYIEGSIAPGPELLEKLFFGRDGVNQPALFGRFYNEKGENIIGRKDVLDPANNKNLTDASIGILRDLIEGASPLSPEAVIKAFSDGDATRADKLRSLLNMIGVGSNKEFEKDKLYDPKAVAHN